MTAKIDRNGFLARVVAEAVRQGSLDVVLYADCVQVSGRDDDLIAELPGGFTRAQAAALLGVEVDDVQLEA